MVFVHAVTHDRGTAQRFVEALIDAGFSPTEIGALRSSKSVVTELALEHKTGVGIAGPAGAILGVALGVFATAQGLVEGPLGSVPSGMVLGGAVGALLGTLAGLAFWRDVVRIPATAFDDGSVLLLGVSTNPGRVQLAESALRSAGADAVHMSQTPGVRAPHAS